MLEQLNGLNRILDDVMCKCIHRPVTLYGNGRSGRFIKWYAKYYHNIDIAFYITDLYFPTTNNSYEAELFQKEVFDYNYKNILSTVVWVTEPMDEEMHTFFRDRGYVLGESYFDFYEMIYGSDYIAETVETDATSRKTGKRDIQPLEYLEWKYKCNFLQRLNVEDYVGVDRNTDVVKNAAPYVVTASKDVMKILDQCHITHKDALFDYGCGKGAVMIGALMNGFEKVGGVEFGKELFETAKDNVAKLGLENSTELLLGDARKVKLELDKYSVFFFFHPFDRPIAETCYENIFESERRRPRKVIIIDINPQCEQKIIESGSFRLKAQMTINTRQRVVNIYENCFY